MPKSHERRPEREDVNFKTRFRFAHGVQQGRIVETAPAFRLIRKKVGDKKQFHGTKAGRNKGGAV
jgi:hypothetical protein